MEQRRHFSPNSKGYNDGSYGMNKGASPTNKGYSPQGYNHNQQFYNSNGYNQNYDHSRQNDYRNKGSDGSTSPPYGVGSGSGSHGSYKGGFSSPSGSPRPWDAPALGSPKEGTSIKNTMRAASPTGSHKGGKKGQQQYKGSSGKQQINMNDNYQQSYSSTYGTPKIKNRLPKEEERVSLQHPQLRKVPVLKKPDNIDTDVDRVCDRVSAELIDTISQSNIFSRAPSECASAASPRWEGPVAFPVKNTFLDFSDEEWDEEDVQSNSEFPVRKTRSLENLKDLQTREAEPAKWIMAPNEWAPALTRVTSEPLFPTEKEKFENPLRPLTRKSFSGHVGGRFTDTENPADIYEKIKSCHGNAAKLAPLARGHSWSNPIHDDNDVINTAVGDDDIEFDLNIEEQEEAVNDWRDSRYSKNGKGWNLNASQKGLSGIKVTKGSGIVQRVNPIPQSYSQPESPVSRFSVSSDPNRVGPRVTQFAGIEYAHTRVPKKKNLQQEFQKSGAPMTTIMIRNIPNRYKQSELVNEINMNGLEGTYDFVYLPMDKSTTSNVGYAFVNFVEEDSAIKAMQIFTGYRFSKYQNISRKIASVSVAHIQGFDANLQHYNESAVNDSKFTENRPLVMATISRMIN